jgi:hypothetical protein
LRSVCAPTSSNQAMRADAPRAGRVPGVVTAA